MRCYCTLLWEMYILQLGRARVGDNGWRTFWMGLASLTDHLRIHSMQVIVELKDAVKDLLMQYYRENGKNKPKALLFYRSVLQKREGGENASSGRPVCL